MPPTEGGRAPGPSRLQAPAKRGGTWKPAARPPHLSVLRTPLLPLSSTLCIAFLWLTWVFIILRTWSPRSASGHYTPAQGPPPPGRGPVPALACAEPGRTAGGGGGPAKLRLQPPPAPTSPPRLRFRPAGIGFSWGASPWCHKG